MELLSIHLGRNSVPDEVEDESLQRAEVCRRQLLQDFVHGVELLLLLRQFCGKTSKHTMKTTRTESALTFRHVMTRPSSSP